MDRRRFRQVRYDLVRVAYDLDQDRWGEPETVVSATKGVAAPCSRASRRRDASCLYLVRLRHFPIYRPDSDLHLLDLRTGEHRRLDEINSEAADTWHCWSGNSRWLVFSSKRGDGLFARPQFTHVDEAGRFSKPFVLPQADPAYYDSCLQPSTSRTDPATGHRLPGRPRRAATRRGAYSGRRRWRCLRPPRRPCAGIRGRAFRTARRRGGG